MQPGHAGQCVEPTARCKPPGEQKVAKCAEGAASGCSAARGKANSFPPFRSVPPRTRAWRLQLYGRCPIVPCGVRGDQRRSLLLKDRWMLCLCCHDVGKHDLQQIHPSIELLPDATEQAHHPQYQQNVRWRFDDRVFA
jgi:hypothetical protein